MENTIPIKKLARLTGIDVDRLLLFEAGHGMPQADELGALAAALRVVPELLVAPQAHRPEGDPSDDYGSVAG